MWWHVLCCFNIAVGLHENNQYKVHSTRKIKFHPFVKRQNIVLFMIFKHLPQNSISYVRNKEYELYIEQLDG
jgi:hypothetical protein